MNGRINSIESMGLVDGPGIRTVVFFQGCNLRCSYCHNPDTWMLHGGTEVSSDELLKKFKRYKSYYKKSKGGVTFSGGEVLLQPEFLLELLKLCKENGIHTTIDTAGHGYGDYDEILKYSDLVILDIKHWDDTEYKKLVGQDKKDFKDFLKALDRSHCKVWIRHVVVPGVTDTEEDIIKLGDIIKNIKNVENIELLPYHTLGTVKYEKLGIKYRLADIEAMDKEKCKKLEETLKEYVKFKK